ncbi:MAG: glucose-6-phosphate isomerase [Pseudomonadota bacterium]
MSEFWPKLTPGYPRDLPAWQALVEHVNGPIASTSMATLFSRDANRVRRFSQKAGDIYADFSKNRINTTTWRLLLALAGEANVEAWRDAMFAGEHINTSEDRAVLHTALRARPRERFRDGGQNATRAVHAVLDAMGAFVNGVHRGRIVGSKRKPFTDIVNIGIGGSDLGIVMAVKALEHHRGKRPRVHSVSNVDGTQLADLKQSLNPATTLFVICSKTFTTQETMSNAAEARRWIRRTLGDAAVQRHFAAASTNHAAMDRFGINPEYRFGFWDWVGGRYSIWSAVGLSVALAIGMKNFRELLDGGRTMDRHFRRAPLRENLPVTMALLAFWYNQFFGAETQAILPYDNRLDRFPAFLQQMQMESNGKSVRIDGAPVTVETGMVIFGEAGNNAQHSFYQLLHQGTRVIPVDFILPARSSGASRKAQRLAVANCLAQSQALMLGRSATEVRASGITDPVDIAQRVHSGNRPSTTLVFPALTPSTLGQLIALYEHKVFVEGVLCGINSFDQWGVQLGKVLAKNVEKRLANPRKTEALDASTEALLATLRKLGV